VNRTETGFQQPNPHIVHLEDGVIEGLVKTLVKPIIILHKASDLGPGLNGVLIIHAAVDQVNFLTGTNHDAVPLLQTGVSVEIEDEITTI